MRGPVRLIRRHGHNKKMSPIRTASIILREQTRPGHTKDETKASLADAIELILEE